MKETYSHEFNYVQKLIQRAFGMWRINRDSVDFKWGYFAPRFGFELMFNRGGYFDQTTSVTICILWGVFNIKLPFKTSIPESCDCPRYGIQIHSDTLWIHLGGKMNDWEQCDSKWITWNIPYVTWQLDFHQQKGADGGWIKSGYENRDKTYKEEHPYSYTLRSGEVQSVIATCTLERWQHHRKWFPFLKRKSSDLWIAFSGEVGEEAGSWKGGTVGCGWEMKKGETISDALVRMQAERKF
jgi:hypothetical protein